MGKLSHLFNIAANGPDLTYIMPQKMQDMLIQTTHAVALALESGTKKLAALTDGYNEDIKRHARHLLVRAHLSPLQTEIMDKKVVAQVARQKELGTTVDNDYSILTANNPSHVRADIDVKGMHIVVDSSNWTGRGFKGFTPTEVEIDTENAVSTRRPATFSGFMPSTF